jgi:hypothetical protein
MLILQKKMSTFHNLGNSSEEDWPPLHAQHPPSKW